MSPFLNALVDKELQRLHEQVIYGTLKLTGFADLGLNNGAEGE